MHIFIICALILLGLFGFAVASYIYGKKKAKKKMICPRKSNCDTVTHSDYSRLLGIKVEILGMLYYAGIVVVYVFVFTSGIWTHTLAATLFGVSACSLIFSLYLVSLQAFVIKQWCTWCLLSAATSFLICILSYIHVWVG